MRHAVIVLLAVFCFGAVSYSQTADELIAKNILARGGMEKMKAIKTIRLTGKFEAGGGFTASVGQENQTATTNQTTQQQVASQATTLRDQVSGVNLDEQATSVLQFQRAYQATAQVLTVLNDVLDTTMNMMTVTT